MSNDVEPRIYVACLASYVNGKLHGRWIDASADVDQMRAEIAEMLADSPEPGAEEWAIHDYEGFGILRIGEYESLTRIAKIVQTAEDNDHIADAVECVSAYVSATGCDETDLPEAFTEAYRGDWDSFKEFACDLFDEMYLSEIPEHLRNYIDYEAYATELDCSGDFAHVANRWVFFTS